MHPPCVGEKRNGDAAPIDAMKAASIDRAMFRGRIQTKVATKVLLILICFPPLCCSLSVKKQAAASPSLEGDRPPPPSATTNAFVPPSIASVDPTVAIPEKFIKFADDFFSSGSSKEGGAVNNAPYETVNNFPASSADEGRSARQFSLLSWNILAQSLYEKGNLRKGSNSPTSTIIPWKTRLEWILKTLEDSNADIICLQEVEANVYWGDLLPELRKFGYEGAVQGGTGVREVKRRKGKGDRAHLVATLWKYDKFEETRIVSGNDKSDEFMAHMARRRTLTSLLRIKEKNTPNSNSTDEPILAIINCHLEGHPNQYAARIQQLQHSLDDLARKVECDGTQSRYQNGNYGVYHDWSPINGLVIAGDFNCELASSACSTYLRIGRVGRKGGLGGVNGPAALAMPTSILESDEAAEVLSPIIEWGVALPNEDMESVRPHPFRRNALISTYPAHLARTPLNHFTYCARPFRPVCGLDQIWYSSLSLKRTVLQQSASALMRQAIVQTGLPNDILCQPSDHLPIGAMFDWNYCAAMDTAIDTKDAPSSTAGADHFGTVRQLIVIPFREPPTPKPISPILAYTEMDMLVSTCYFDNEKQRSELEYLLECNNNVERPSAEEILELREMSSRKTRLIKGASEQVRPTLQRILKLHKEVAKYEQEMGF